MLSLCLMGVEWIVFEPCYISASRTKSSISHHFEFFVDSLTGLGMIRGEMHVKENALLINYMSMSVR